MRDIKLLHIYSQTMDLYGDYSNITAIDKYIKEMGYNCSITCVELGEEINTTDYDFVYMGHGKAKNLNAVAPHFVKYKDHILSQIENEQIFFVTGNARLLFGKEFQTFDNKRACGIGLFDYTAIETGDVFTSDVISRPVFDESIVVYGFINRTSHMVGENKYPLFKVISGSCDGEIKTSLEGNLYKNYIGTWQMGPLLLRNPALLKDILKRILKEDYKEVDTTLEEKALALTLKEFKELN